MNRQEFNEVIDEVSENVEEYSSGLCLAFYRVGYLVVHKTIVNAILDMVPISADSCRSTAYWMEYAGEPMWRSRSRRLFALELFRQHCLDSGIYKEWSI